MPKIHNLHVLRDRRRELRKNPTPEEEKLWEFLRNKKLGVKFRRQHSIGGYILDFICKDQKLIIEIDGGIHLSKEAREYDEVRDKFFTSLDHKVLRFTNEEVNTNIVMVIQKIRESLKTK